MDTSSQESRSTHQMLRPRRPAKPQRVRRPPEPRVGRVGIPMGEKAATIHAKGVDINDDPKLEQEADEHGARAARGEAAGPGAAAGRTPRAIPAVRGAAKAASAVTSDEPSTESVSAAHDDVAGGEP